jgi:uncharacterized protein YegP (UPF0339 family)
MTITVEGPSQNYQYWVRVKASNGQILANSELYTTKANAVHCAQLIKSGASSASIIDNTV